MARKQKPNPERDERFAYWSYYGKCFGIMGIARKFRANKFTSPAVQELADQLETAVSRLRSRMEYERDIANQEKATRNG
jgi:hypothetical protein